MRQGRPGAMRVLFHLDSTDVLRRRLSPQLDGLDVVWCGEHDNTAFRRLLPEVDVLWHVLRPITRSDLDQAPRLRLIQKLGVGVNTIDLDAARQHGIAVANMPGTNSQAVAEATLLLMLATLRRLTDLDRRTRQGEGWPLDPTLADQPGELADKTVGLVGYGDIARRLETMLNAIGARTLHTRRTSGDRRWRPLDVVLAESHLVSLHVPLTPDTHHLIDAARLRKMRADAILINTSRGAVVDQTALTRTLQHGGIRGVGLDVFAIEPIDPTDPLLALDNVVVTPHTAWLTAETIERCTEVAADNCRRLMAGRPLLHQVV